MLNLDTVRKEKEKKNDACDYTAGGGGGGGGRGDWGGGTGGGGGLYEHRKTVCTEC